MKEVVSAIVSTTEIIRQNKWQMSFLYKVVSKQDVDYEVIINVITFLLLEYTSISDYDKMDNGVSKSTVLEPTTKHLMKKTSLGRSPAHTLVRRGQSIRAEIPLSENFTLKLMRGRLIYSTINKPSREEIVEWILSHTNFKPLCESSDVVTIINPESNQKEVFPKNVNVYFC